MLFTLGGLLRDSAQAFCNVFFSQSKKSASLCVAEIDLECFENIFGESDSEDFYGF